MEEKKSYWALIPANVRYDEALTSGAKLLYAEISCLCNEKGYCWATNEYFSNLYGVSDRSIRNWIEDLIKQGYIERELIYRDGTKEIEKRKLYMSCSLVGVENNFHTSGKNFPEGGEKNFLDNNKNINNKINKEKYKRENTEDANASVNVVDYQFFVDQFNTLCPSCPKVTKLTDKRKKAIKRRLKTFSEDEIYQAFAKAEKSDFMTGHNDRGWKARFDWFFENDDNIQKVLEGNYDNKSKTKEDEIDARQRESIIDVVFGED